MAQHDYVIANGTGAAVRSDLNNALAAIVSNNSGATEPATMYAYQWWADTSTGLLKLRNAANNAWITLRELDGTLTIEDGTASSPGLAFADDLNTGIYSPSADQLGITTGGTVRLTTTTTGITSALPVDVPLGTASAPTVTFTGDLNTGIYSPGADQVAISTNGSSRVTVDSSGRLLVGTSTAFDTSILATVYGAGIEGNNQFTGIAVKTNKNSGESAYLVLGKSRGTTANSKTIVQSGDGLGFISFEGADGTNMLQAATIVAQVDGTPGTNDMPGRLVFSTTADGASSPTERMRIDNAGNVLFAKTSTDTTVAGSCLAQSDDTGFQASFTSFDNRTIIINRQSNDGDLISFRQAGTEEGTISVSGTTVSYNGAHLSRWSQLPGGDERKEILRGTVLSNIDEMCEWGEEDNEQLNRMKVSDVEGDKNVSGVFQAWDDDDDTYINDFYCAMTGDFIIRIAQGVMVERGDLLMSAGDGTAKPQEDDIIRSKTIAKVTSTNVSCTYDDGSYCVPCVLMAC